MMLKNKVTRAILMIALIGFVSVIFFTLGSNTNLRKPFSIQLSQEEWLLILISVVCGVADWIALFRKEKQASPAKKGSKTPKK